jgi:hypothetical protein
MAQWGKGLKTNLRWVTDFQGALTVPVLVEYLELYQALDQVELQPEIPDEHTWRLSILH